ncbi:hypothetical protein M2271_001307 [Streptomyces sp. LBL]|uniref:hypothetical protein n=1 Tax=Streptomyces sp. LBL TaxID=2940562 RepID=UPI0024765403|nr:hypothetical protein [Streptomyces sp. LBL]MDH6623520.1 hypothetical protein [Streptomyces sp. LBL]
MCRPGAKVLSYGIADGGAAGTLRLEVDGTKAVLRAAGPYAADTAFDLPKVTVRLKAPVRRGSLETAFGGTSHDDPGFSWSFISSNWDGEAQLACWPDQPIALTRTIVN